MGNNACKPITNTDHRLGNAKTIFDAGSFALISFILHLECLKIDWLQWYFDGLTLILIIQIEHFDISIFFIHLNFDLPVVFSFVNASFIDVFFPLNSISKKKWVA